MSNAPLMPMATAVWLVDNTTLTFDQIATFVGLHPLEIQALADEEVSIGIVPRNPIENGELSKDEIQEECSDLIKQFTNPIALHIRRGDFVWNNKNHPPLSLDYYKSALELFDSDREVIIFSDDTEWCIEQELFADDRFSVAEGGDQFYDMCLMSLCDDFIIANSTFSWWGAWLANRGKVVAPKQWFGEALNHDTKDLYCKGWTVL